MDVYHMLGSQGSEPRNESEGRIAGGKSPLSTLLLFLAVHAKIKQQLKKSLHPQSCGNDCWSSQHSGSTSPCRKRTKEMRYWTSFIPFETSLSFPLWNKSLSSQKSRVMDLRGRMTKWQLGTPVLVQRRLWSHNEVVPEGFLQSALLAGMMQKSQFIGHSAEILICSVWW